LHQGFANGAVDTGLIARDIDNLVIEPVATGPVVALAALGALGLSDDVLPETGFSPGFTLWAPLQQMVRLVAGETEYEVKVSTLGGGRYALSLQGEEIEISRGGAHWQVGSGSFKAHVVRQGASVSVFAGHGFHLDIVDPLQSETSHAGDGNLIEAPMPGLVKAVFVKQGERVAQGDKLAILEAMKMEHALLAARDGVVAEVLVSEGDQVEAGAALVRLEDAS